MTLLKIYAFLYDLEFLLIEYDDQKFQQHVCQDLCWNCKICCHDSLALINLCKISKNQFTKQYTNKVILLKLTEKVFDKLF